MIGTILKSNQMARDSRRFEDKSRAVKLVLSFLEISIEFPWLNNDRIQRLGKISTSERRKRIGEDQEPSRRVKKTKYELAGEECDWIIEERTYLCFYSGLEVSNSSRGMRW